MASSYSLLTDNKVNKTCKKVLNETHAVKFV